MSDALASSGHQVVVITESRADADHYKLDPAVRRIALDTEWQTSGWSQKLRANAVRLRHLRAHILAADSQAAIAFGETTNIRVLLSCIGTGIPVVVSERTDPRRHRIPRVWEWLRGWQYRRAAAVVVQSESVAQWARCIVDPAKVHIIPNPVRPLLPAAPRPAGLPRGGVVMGVGRFTAEKGFGFLIEGFARSGLPAQGWCLVILGEGPDRVALEEQVDALGLRRSVLLPGLVAEPEHWLRHADVFVLSSLYEGFPNALLEAMACGTAAIAFDCPSGPREIMRDGETGLLLPLANVEALAQALRELASDPHRRRRLGRAAAADVNARFALPTIVKQWEKMLDSVVESADSGT